MLSNTHEQWLENDFQLDLEIDVRVEWKYSMKTDNWYFHIWVGELEITKALKEADKEAYDHAETCALDQKMLMKEDYENER